MSAAIEDQGSSQAETEETVLLQKLIKRINVKDAGKRAYNEQGTVQEI